MGGQKLSHFFTDMRRIGYEIETSKALQGGVQFVPPLALEFQSIPSPNEGPFKRWLARSSPQQHQPNEKIVRFEGQPS